MQKEQENITQKPRKYAAGLIAVIFVVIADRIA